MADSASAWGRGHYLVAVCVSLVAACLLARCTANEYGKTLTGRLVIVTEEMQWTYEVRGTHPEYKAPQKQSRIDSKLNKSLSSELSRAQGSKGKNFLRQNMSVKSVSSSKKGGGRGAVGAERRPRERGAQGDARGGVSVTSHPAEL